MRIDKFIWAVRLYKTRTLATKECKQNRVLVNDEFIKPSRELRIGDEITLKKGAIFYSFKVKAFPKSRVGAKLVDDLIKNITPVEELEKMELIKETNKISRTKGMGRPTKRERRAMNKFLEEDSDDTSE